MGEKKRHTTEGIELPNQVRTLREKVNLQVLGNIGSRHYQTNVDERKNI